MHFDNQTKLQILEIIADKGPIAGYPIIKEVEARHKKELGVPNLYYHLKKLRDEGLIESERRYVPELKAERVCYRITRDGNARLTREREKQLLKERSNGLRRLRPQRGFAVSA